MKIKLKNRLDVLMRDSGVRSVEELAQRLTSNQGYAITRTPLSRKFNNEDVQLTLTLIEALCNEFQCLPGDLFQIDVVDATPDWVDEIQSRVPPFRYGSLRMKKPGATEEPAAAPSSAEAALPQKTEKAKATSKQTKQVDEDDDLTGPKVTHLNASKLKRKQ